MGALRQFASHPLVRRLIQGLWIAAVVVFLVYYVARNWGELRQYPWTFAPWWLAAALALAMVRRFLGGIRWVLIAGQRLAPPAQDVPPPADPSSLTPQASSLTPPAASSLTPSSWSHLRIYMLSNLATYIPGSIWYMASRLRMSKDQGMSTLRTSLGMIYEMGLLVATGAAVGAYAAATALGVRALPAAGLTVAAILLSLLAVHPALANLVLPPLLKLLKRPPVRVEAPLAWTVNLWLSSLGIWLAGGLSLFCLIKSLAPQTPLSAFTQIASAAALAWTVGFLAPWAPSGLGVREGLLGFLLKAAVPGPALLVALLAARLVTLFEDVLWAIIVILPRGKKRVVACATSPS